MLPAIIDFSAFPGRSILSKVSFPFLGILTAVGFSFPFGFGSATFSGYDWGVAFPPKAIRAQTPPAYHLALCRFAESIARSRVRYVTELSYRSFLRRRGIAWRISGFGSAFRFNPLRHTRVISIACLILLIIADFSGAHTSRYVR